MVVGGVEAAGAAAVAGHGGHAVGEAIPWGPLVLNDLNIHSYFIDPAITGNGTASVANDEPLP